MSAPNESNNQSDDKKDIEVEEREKILNAENKMHEVVIESTDSDNKESKLKTECREGREVKPKKIPIGGIQMPGFFTRSRSKEKCKEGESEQETEGSDLLQEDDKEKKDDSLLTQTRIKLPNPFRKSKAEEDDKMQEKQGKKLIGSIRLPIVSVMKNKNKNSEPQAELASVETLGDNDKSSNADDLKNVPLNDEDEKNETEEATCMQKFKAYKILISALLLFLLLLVILIISIISGKDDGGEILSSHKKYVTTSTSCGQVEGLRNDGAVAFRGIPYARPPIGDLRFRPAQPLNNLSYCWNNTLLTHNASELCIQFSSNGTIIGTEDCLTLDVVTPYVKYDNPLPVIVLIGADSFIEGSPGKMRPSARFARSRDVVFVRPNFRIGVLGFLALDILSKDAYPHTSGNYGLSDIIQALHWIQLNIHHFGGNPKSVTLFGHKAGATLVTALSTMRDARKYFAGAWSTSGGALFPSKTLNESEKDHLSYLSSVQCSDVACLRSKSAEDLQNAIEDTWRKSAVDLPPKQDVPDKRHEWLVRDGKILMDRINSLKDQNLTVNLVIGTTAHVSTSNWLLLKHKNWTESLVQAHIRHSIVKDFNLTDETLKMYPNNYKGLITLISDIRTVCPLYLFRSNFKNVPFYVVTQTRGEHDLADADSDVDAILGRYEPKTPEQRRYLSSIQQLFYHFVWHGEIKHMLHGSQKMLVIGQDPLPEHSYSHCNFWISKKVVPKYAQLD